MRAGQLRHKVKLQALAVGQDAIGQPVQTWTDVATVWADVRFINGLEAVKADAPVSIAKGSIRIRYRVGVTAGMRVLEGSIVYSIQAILPDTTGKRFLDLAFEQGANNG
ncbi:phage head closure protein [Variovorax sp. GT1P44]|uniref:phage head closure protein n=1 Tax=Variovorax sp. GT1P44 TaxID=3443742 RepID=UPI003F44BC91